MVNITPENAHAILAALNAKVRHLDSDDGPESDGPEPDRAESDRAEPPEAAGGDGIVHGGVGGALAQWGSAVRDLVDAPCAVLSDRQLTDDLIEADRLRRASDAAYLRLIAEVDARRAAPGSRIGAVSTANLLTAGCGATPGRAKADIDAAHALYTSTVETSALVPTSRPGPLAGMTEMLESGTVQLGHVDTAVRTLDRIPERLTHVGIPSTGDDADGAGSSTGDVDERAAEILVGFFATHAPTMSPRKMAELGDEVLRQIAPPDDDLYDPEAFNRRDLAMNTDLAGMVHGHYQLDADAGAMFAAIIDTLSAPRPGETGATSESGPDGPGVTGGTARVQDPRKPGQRRADALTEIIRLAAARLNIHPAPAASGATPVAGQAQDRGLFDLTPATGDAPAGTSRAGRLRAGRRAPRIVIVTTEDQVRAHPHGSDAGGRGSNGTDCRYGPVDPSRSYSPGLGLVDAGMVARTACDAIFESLKVDGNGAIVSLSSGARLASRAQRRALDARDRGCTFPGCNRPASWCDAHHVIWFSRGGPTSTDNLALLCPAHHSLIHTGQWAMTMIDGIPYARPAPGRCTPAIYGTTATGDGWMRNTYFDALADAGHAAAEIRHLA